MSPPVPARSQRQPMKKRAKPKAPPKAPPKAAKPRLAGIMPDLAAPPSLPPQLGMGHMSNFKQPLGKGGVGAGQAKKKR